MKCLTDTVESSATVSVGADRVRLVLPEGAHPDWHIKRQFAPQQDEASAYRWRLPAAQAYARANRLDRVTHDAQQRTLGIVAAGNPGPTCARPSSCSGWTSSGWPRWASAC